MSDFRPALEFLLPHEGGYANDHDDPGGETYAGISRVFHPDWEGWALVDGAKAHDGFPASLKDNPGLQSSVAAFYYKSWWTVAPFFQLDSQDVANKVFDLSVNFGMHPHLTCEYSPAFKFMQRAACDSGQLINCDGIFGPLTLKAVNLCDPVALLEGIRQYAADHYRAIVLAHPERQKFLNNWLVRASA